MRQNLQNVVDFFNDTTGFSVNRLVDQLALVSTEYGIDIPVPVVIKPHFVKDNQYPFVSVVPARTSYDKEQVNPIFRKTHQMNILVGFSELNYDRLTAVILGYSQAVEHLLLADPTLNGRCVDAGLVDIDYTLVVTNPETKKILMSAQMLLEVRPLQRADEIDITN